MQLADLQNDLTLKLVQVHHDFLTEIVSLTFRLDPTLGTIVQDQADQYRVYQIEYNRQEGTPEQQAIYDALVDRSPQEMMSLLQTSYQEYILLTPEEKDVYDSQLRMLFDYVQSVGVKP